MIKMYYYINGKKIKHNKQVSTPSHESYVQINQRVGDPGGGKCPSWVFIILGLIAALVAIWLIWCIVKRKRLKTGD
jgi:hypothetical protein